MKTSAFVLITLIVGSFASPTLPAIFNRASVPETSDERIVTGQIIRAIELLAQQIRDAGLDPYVFNAEFEYELPVPVLLSVNAIVDNFVFRGLSNIVVQRMNYSVIQNRLTFTIVLPALGISVDNAEANIVLFGKDYAGSVSGSVIINQARIIGDIRITVGVISGITVRRLSLEFSISSIESNLNINLFGKDLSSKVNTYLGTTLPATLREFAKEINELLEAFAWSLINDLLNRQRFFSKLISV